MEKQIEVITYEQDRLNYFTDLMNKAQERYNRLFKQHKDAPYASVEAQALSDAGREAQFYGDVVEMLEKGDHKQSEKYLIKENGDILPLTHHSEWISVTERMPDGQGHFLTVDDTGYMMVAMWTKQFGWFSHICKANKITHWMPLPEPPEMKGGA